MLGSLQCRVVAIGLAFLLTCSAAAQRGEGNGNIVGRIRASKAALPSEALLVSVHTRGQLVGNVYADSEGKFGFYDLAPNAYEVTLTVQGYEPITQVVRIDPLLSPTQFVELVLNPVAVRAQQPGDQRPKGSNPYLINAAGLLATVPKSARKDFEKAVKVDREGKTEEAITLYRRALEKAPEFYPARNNLGSDYLAKRDYTRAEKQFSEVIRENSQDSEAYFNLGNVYLLTKRFHESNAILLQGMSKDSNSAFGHFLLGSVYEQVGRFADAERELRKTLEIEPTYAKSHLQLVNLYMAQKNTAAARNELQTFIAKFPENPFSAKARELLEKLERSAN